MVRQRMCWLSCGLLCVALLAAWSERDELSPQELSLAWGGDPSYATKKVFCDQESGVYSGCAQVNGTCVQCVDAQGNPSQAVVVDFNNPVAAGTGQQEGQNSQDCGVIYRGTCVADPNSPTGFMCNGAATKNVCTEGIFTTVPQQLQPVPPASS